MNAPDVTAMAEWMAGEATGDEPMVNKVLGYAEFLTTFAVVVTNVGLWWITSVLRRDEARRYNDSIDNANDNLADANDNMTDVALAEIDAHHQNVARMTRLANLRRQRRRDIRDSRTPKP